MGTNVFYWGDFMTKYQCLTAFGCLLLVLSAILCETVIDKLIEVKAIDKGYIQKVEDGKVIWTKISQ